MLMKLTPGVNFINILQEPFSNKSALHSFSLITIWLWNFLSKEYLQKAPCKMFVEMIKGVSNWQHRTTP
jgi:hypothetical protein